VIRRARIPGDSMSSRRSMRGRGKMTKLLIGL
jgi:hypothetical protein